MNPIGTRRGLRAAPPGLHRKAVPGWLDDPRPKPSPGLPERAAAVLRYVWAMLKRPPFTAPGPLFQVGDRVYLHPILGGKHDGRIRVVLGWRRRAGLLEIVVSNGNAPDLRVVPEALSLVPPSHGTRGPARHGQGWLKWLR